MFLSFIESFFEDNINIPLIVIVVPMQHVSFMHLLTLGNFILQDSMVDYVNDILEFVHYVSESLLTASSSIQRDAYKLLCRKRSDLQEVSFMFFRTTH